MISPTNELRNAVARPDEDQAQETLVVLHLLWDEETRQEILDLIRKLAPSSSDRKPKRPPGRCGGFGSRRLTMAANPSQ